MSRLLHRLAPRLQGSFGSASRRAHCKGGTAVPAAAMPSGRTCGTARVAPLLALALAVILSGCHHHTETSSMVALAPPVEGQPGKHQPKVTRGKMKHGEAPVVAGNKPPAHATPDVPMYQSNYVEEGMASWYGPGFQHRKSANGKTFDQNGLTAAHRTLPMGSIIKVTNLRTQQSTTLEVTDRGPFVPDRMIDLSMGAAKELGIYQSGTAPVRLELVSSPKPPTVEGRWCVQIGVFKSQGNSVGLKQQLLKKYSDAQVLEFAGPDGHWVRIRPPNGDKTEAFAIARGIHPSEGNAYLVRLD